MIINIYLFNCLYFIFWGGRGEIFYSSIISDQHNSIGSVMATLLDPNVVDCGFEHLSCLVRKIKDRLARNHYVSG